MINMIYPKRPIFCGKYHSNFINRQKENPDTLIENLYEFKYQSHAPSESTFFFMTPPPSP